MAQKKSDQKGPSQQRPNQQNSKAEAKETVEGVAKFSRGGGQPKPRTPSGEVKPWNPPEKETTPSNRKK